ncbi:peptidoglycan-binding protein [Rhizobium sp. WYCCWR 11290]|uniref:Peptidoglycan-binding protein n=1 Tax=Rhizobium changzhiense TaxID=2692317 RepID=A0A7Z0UHY8_9HYPH|nr:peptidoglycan-binding protein [Rhizobium changzhiense]NZD66183.1 peptidoglycan-binding protein [Rhizobium changzhiense]
MNIIGSNIRDMSRTAVRSIVDGIVANQTAIVKGGIDTPLRLSHFMAQLAHESAHFGTTREFASGAAYEGRRDLGNTQSGDGRRYRGRGLIQTTGRANYREATADIRAMDAAAPDFEREPEALEQFPWALLAGISYWRRRNINRHADRDDVRAVTRAINGGLNGFEDRIRYLGRAKSIWMEPNTPTATHPVLRRGDKGNDVVDLQNELIGAGYRVFADGDFGRHTEKAVRDLQSRHRLGADGIVGARTWAILLLRSGNG